MPIIKKFEGNNFYEDYEEINEYSPLKKEDFEYELISQNIQVNLPFWKKIWRLIKLRFSKK